MKFRTAKQGQQRVNPVRPLQSSGGRLKSLRAGFGDVKTSLPIRQENVGKENKIDLFVFYFLFPHFPV
jgi:hypothetical protein